MEKAHSTTFDNQLIELESVDSTNNYAMGLIHAGLASSGQVCLARHQWAGKGQRGKEWQDEAGQNLMMSLIIAPQGLLLSRQYLLSAAVTLGILDATPHTRDGEWRIKWPNDIYWNDRKAAGILIESVIQGENWPWAVVGIGMNLNQISFPEDLSHAISLKQITGMDYEPVSLAREMVPAIQSRIDLLRTDPMKILEDFNHVLYKNGQTVGLKKGDELIVASLQGVNDQGLLLTDSGTFTFGEVSFVVNR